MLGGGQQRRGGLQRRFHLRMPCVVIRRQELAAKRKESVRWKSQVAKFRTSTRLTKGR